jgi:hypothetical protein
MYNKYNSMNKKIVSLLDPDLVRLFGAAKKTVISAQVVLGEMHRAVAEAELRVGPANELLEEARLQKELLIALIRLKPSQLSELAGWIAGNEALPSIDIGSSVYVLLRAKGQKIERLCTVLRDSSDNIVAVMDKAREILRVEPLKRALQNALVSWDRARLDLFSRSILIITSVTSFDLPGSTYDSLELDADRVLRIIEGLGNDVDAFELAIDLAGVVIADPRIDAEEFIALRELEASLA